MTWRTQYANGQWWTWNDEPPALIHEAPQTELKARVDDHVEREKRRHNFQEYLANVEQRIVENDAELSG